MTTSLATLTAAFDETFARVGQDADRDRSTVVVAWPSVPVELVRAAGLRPVVARGAAAPCPAADKHLEPGIFPSRLRHLADAALDGRLADVACIVVPRTSDADYKGFLYLRELVRRGAIRAAAPVMLFDLLQSDGPDVPAYNAARAADLFEALARLGGRAPSMEAVRREIERANGARDAVRRLLALRRGAPRVTGTEVFPLLGAFWQMAPDDYAALASEAVETMARRPPLEGPRVLLAGAPVDGAALHAAIESLGAIVVAEIGPWGSGVAGDDVAGSGDPMAALAGKYRVDAIGARSPAGSVRRWLARALDDVDAVVVSLPPEDTVFGWDVPALRDLLEARGTPYACLGNDPYGPLTDSERATIEDLVAAARPRAAVRHG